MMRYGSVCSGIEAATVAWHPLGWKPAFFSEVDPAACRVLHHHYGSGRPRFMPSPEAEGLSADDVARRRAAIRAVNRLPAHRTGPPNLGDMTQFREWPDHAIDLLVGGTRCQSFSIAGLRRGLADPRGNLMLTYLAIAQRYRPQWLVWENVPGVLSSNGGRDFGTFLGAVGELGYGFAYRVLDAQYIRTQRFSAAVPQRRRRVFVVGYLGDWRRAAAVLFERESLSGHPPPRRKTGQAVACDVAPSLTESGRGVERSGDSRGQDPVIAIASTGNVSHCLNGGGMKRIDFESETLVTHALKGEGFDASEDGTGRGVPIVPQVAATLPAAANAGGGHRQPGTSAETCTTMLVPIAIQERAVSENPDCGPKGKGYQEGVAFSLEARAVTQAVAFDCKGTEVQTVEDGTHAPLRSMGHLFSHGNAGGHAAVAYDNRARNSGAQLEGPHDTANIRAGSGGSSRSFVADSSVNWAVRRLMPVECERLQGFPDGYTALAGSDTPQADGPRYKQLGNSMACNVMDWLGQRIAAVAALPATGVPAA